MPSQTFVVKTNPVCFVFLEGQLGSLRKIFVLELGAQWQLSPPHDVKFGMDQNRGLCCFLFFIFLIKTRGGEESHMGQIVAFSLKPTVVCASSVRESCRAVVLGLTTTGEERAVVK